jgi:hypothetical protein
LPDIPFSTFTMGVGSWLGDWIEGPMIFGAKEAKRSVQAAIPDAMAPARL